MENRNQLSCDQQLFGTLPNGEAVTQFQLTNSNGVCAKIINYGATLTSFKLPAENNPEIVLGFDTLEDYLKHEFYFGCTIGRVANRIAHGRFTYQDKTYSLACNFKQRHHIHGGVKGFDKVVWRGEAFSEDNAVGVKFSYLSKDGEEGYPGNLEVICTYILTNDNELKINFWAKTDKATPIDLTNHTYWNLAGEGDVLDHELQVFADRYIITDQEYIPNGEIRSVHNTPLDFTQPRVIGDRIKEAGGYDLFYFNESPLTRRATRVEAAPPSLRSPHKGRGEIKLIAKLIEHKTKRAIEVLTTQPGLQFYTGNSLYEYTIAGNRKINKYSAFCLETQGFPDAVNHLNFPSPFLLPDQVYQQETIYKLGF
jgi:aldose 1-epimerase